MNKCRWYVSIEQQECGEPAEAEITHVVIRGKPKKLDEPIPVCHVHKQRNAVRFAQVRKKSRTN